VVLISLVFALSHSHYLGSWLALVTVFIQSVILCVARIKTDSLAPTFLAHAVYNFIAIVRIWLMPI
jgi:membrane protease YdiL (CAAX protease family)